MIGWRSKNLPGFTKDQLLQKQHSRAGFTLIEVIIAVGVFSITVVMAVNLFIVFVQQQRRMLNQQELQNDARAVMEQIAKDVREGSIDYEYYSTVFMATKTKLYSQLSSDGGDVNNADNCLVLRSSTNEQILYRMQSSVVERYVTDTPSTAACKDILIGWEKISPESLHVASFVFSISPTVDPFGAKSAKACGVPGAPVDGGCDWGMTCAIPSTTTCVNEHADTCYCYPQRFGEVTPLHPRVTYAFNVSRTSNQQTITQVFQTTVASRQFKNLDRLNSYVP